MYIYIDICTYREGERNIKYIWGQPDIYIYIYVYMFVYICMYMYILIYI